MIRRPARLRVAQYASVVILFNIVDKLFGSVYVARLADRGLTPIEIGVLISIGSILLTVLDYPSGNVADVFGRKKTGGIGFIVWGFGILLWGIADSMPLFVLAIASWALGISLISGTPQAWFVDEMKKADQAERLRSVMPLVRTTSLVIGAAAAWATSLMVQRGLNVPLVVGGLVSVGTGVAMLVLLPENHGERKWSVKEAIWRNTRHLISHPVFRLLLLKAAVSAVAFHIFIMAWQLYAIQVIQLPKTMLGFVLAGLILLLATGNALSALLMKHLTPVAVSFGGLIGVFAGLVTIAYWPTLWGFALGVILLELGLGLEGGSSDVWFHELIPSERRASFVSALSSAEAFVGIIMPPASGLIIQAAGFRPAWLTGAISSLLAAALVVIIARLSSTKVEAANATSCTD